MLQLGHDVRKSLVLSRLPKYDGCQCYQDYTLITPKCNMDNACKSLVAIALDVKSVLYSIMLHFFKLEIGVEINNIYPYATYARKRLDIPCLWFEKV